MGQTVKKNYFSGFIHFMKFPASLVQVWFFTHPSHHHLKLWWENFSSPNGPNSEKNYFSGFIHFMEFPAFLVQLWFFTHPLTTTTSNFDEKILQVQMGQTVKKIFLVDLSISWNFLHFWFSCDFSHTLPPPPPQTLMRKFYKSKWAKQWKKIILVDLSISWNFLHFWFSCDFSHTLPPPPPQTLMRKFYKSKWAKQWKKIILVDLSISWNFLHFWFSCDFSHMPPPPPQTLMRKFSKSKWAKQWKKFFFSGFINFMKFPAFLVQLWFFTHAPTTTSNFDEKIF